MEDSIGLFNACRMGSLSPWQLKLAGKSLGQGLMAAVFLEGSGLVRQEKFR